MNYILAVGWKSFRHTDKIINALNASPMTKTELCRYLGYARVVNSVSHQLSKLIMDNQVIEINKKYHLK